MLACTPAKLAGLQDTVEGLFRDKHAHQLLLQPLQPLLIGGVHWWGRRADLHVQGVDKQCLPCSVVICSSPAARPQLSDNGVVGTHIRLPHAVQGPRHPIMVEHLLENAPPGMQHLHHVHHTLFVIVSARRWGCVRTAGVGRMQLLCSPVYIQASR